MDAREKTPNEHVANVSKIEITNNDFNRQVYGQTDTGTVGQTDNICIARLTISNRALFLNSLFLSQNK